MAHFLKIEQCFGQTTRRQIDPHPQRRVLPLFAAIKPGRRGFYSARRSSVPVQKSWGSISKKRERERERERERNERVGVEERWGLDFFRR